jgi:glucose/arabinose dehydrogenase
MQSTCIFLLLLLVSVYCDISVDRLRTLPGFSIRLLTLKATYARQMSLTDDESILFHGSGGDTIYAYRVSNDGKNVSLSDPIPLVSNLYYPGGIVYDDSTGTLFFSDHLAVYGMPNVRDQMAHGTANFQIVRNYSNPAFAHNVKYLKIYNDRLFVPQGSPCNTCLMDLPYGTISSIKKDGSDYKVHARGIRNSCGHAMRGNKLWFTENSRDYWGNDNPHDEVNVIDDLNQIQHFGFPFCYNNGEPDPDYNKNGTCSEYTLAAYELGAHMAPLGITFYNAGTSRANVPVQFQGDNIAIFAEHGSWNRDIPNGYRVSMIDVNNADPSSYQVFVDGWLNLPQTRNAMDTDYAFGRPTDVLMMKDGSVLISDDKANAIYILTYTGTGIEIVSNSTVTPAPTDTRSSASTNAISMMIVLIFIYLI